MEIDDSTPQILLDLLRTSSPHSPRCLLCNDPHIINISKDPISKNLKVSYNRSFCQFMNLEIPENLKPSLGQTVYCEKCLQLVLDIHSFRTGVQAYEKKLRALKLRTEQLLYGLAVKNESESPVPQDPAEFYEDEPGESNFSVELVLEEEYPNFVPPKQLKLKPIITQKTKTPKTKSKSKPPKLVVTDEPQPMFTGSGRVVSKSNAGTGTGDSDADDPFQETSNKSDSEDFEFENPKKKPKSSRKIPKTKIQNPSNRGKRIRKQIRVKNWACTQCPEKFWRSSRLVAHTLRDHLKESPKLKCLLCDKLFYVQEFVKDHYRHFHKEADLTDLTI